MKKLFILFFSLTFSSLIYAQGKQYEIDFKKPESVLNAVFYAAQTKHFSILQCLGDPFQENDSDVKTLCSLSYVAKQISNYGGNDQAKKTIEEFLLAFSIGRISGPTTYEKVDGLEYANVPFIFSNANSGNKESMSLVKRFGNWYLSSF